MTADSTGTDSDSKEAGATGVVPPESQGEDGKAPDGYVKRTQFIAALNEATRKNDLLIAENAALKAASAKPEKKPPTKAELQQLVDSGDLTQVAADTLWEKQIVERAERAGAAAATQTMSAQERERLVKAELSSYRELVPDAWDKGSSDHAKLVKEYQRLVGLGNPEGLATEAAALRVVFGDHEVLRASKAAKPGSAETHSEIGGGKPADGGRKDSLKSLTPAQKAYYQKGIDAGRYKDWDDVKAEVEFKPKRSA